ncbi:hypothetical protein OCOL_001496 [Ordospora colligata]|uniref:Signal recognition particle receptor subunit beta n=1 Tax=Ordospora colligata OC4 TaxID=1354746 RepID=A0A0B2UGZ5_9MICR|nr:uncharacterized protein M896_021700 [Ordospora colligata OC4]KHN70331.1 hypothetical protein M896_021700 [Ordospora colligata OC4]TBU16875.1 hypothetical protein CWI41_021710 [Ordospora colligata]TBU16983.1 hypothetical protein CWI40_021710 [Ordospora colligata]
MIFVFFLIVLTLAYMLFMSVKGRKGSSIVKFVGPRGTGKTTTLNALLRVNGKTVPTLESYKVMYESITIHDVIEKEGSFLEKYGIDDASATYFFFLKDFNDACKHPETKGFDIRLVYFGSCDASKAKEQKVIVLNGNPSEIKIHLPN